MLTSKSEQDALIQQIRRDVLRLRDTVRDGSHDVTAIHTEVRLLATRLLGADAGMLEHLDVLSATRLVGSPSRVALWVELLDLDADLWRQSGDSQRAAALASRAAALRALTSHQSH